MTHKEIEMHRKELAQVLANINEEKPGGASSKGLRQLALAVGACPIEYVKTSSGPRWSKATEETLAYNIHQALQTTSMIDACRTAANNHRVSVVAAAVAVVAALAAWTGVIVTTICGG